MPLMWYNGIHGDKKHEFFSGITITYTGGYPRVTTQRQRHTNCFT